MDLIVNRELKNKACVEYCRKSTESDDRQAFSLEDQQAVTRNLVSRYEMHLKDKYSESKSAEKRGRPLFNEMVSNIELGKYSVIVCWALNRLARNAVDGAILIELLDNKKLHAIVTPGKVYYNSGDDKVALQIEFTFAKKYSDDLGPSVMRGMLSALKRGKWPGIPKPGYLNVREKGEVIQVVDSERFPLLRKGVEMVLEGAKVQNIVDTLNDKYGYRTVSTAKTGNKPLSLSSFYRILHDSFYYGRMVWNGEVGELSPNVQRLMTEDEYWHIQDRLGNKGVPRPYVHKDVPYRGIIKCSVCGSTIITYPKKKKLKNGVCKTYYYAQCSNKKGCSQQHISLSVLEEQLVILLSNIKISKDFHDWFLYWLKKDNEKENIDRNIGLQNLELQIAHQYTRRSNLLDLRIDNQISELDYNQKKNEIEEEIKRLEIQRSGVKYQSDDWMTRAEKRIDYALYAQDKLINGTSDEKTEKRKYY